VGFGLSSSRQFWTGNIMATYYTNIGLRRGGCGHQHRSIASAAKCQLKESRACRRWGHYSDRNLRVMGDGVVRRPTQAERDEYLDTVEKLEAEMPSIRA
jgi:hypothetical protein